MKRFLTVFLSALLLCSMLCVPASAASFTSAAEELSAIGMFRGTDKGFELDRAPTRSEAAIMLVRLYGAEEEATADYASGEITHPFTDVGSFASPYVAWLYSNGITKGTSDTTFSASKACTAQNYLAFLLRALGYEDGTDFQYASIDTFAEEKGLFDTSMFSDTFLRDDLAAVTYQGLSCDLKDGSTYLLDSLIKDGAIDAKAAQPITDKIENYRMLLSSAKDMGNSLDVSISAKADASFSSKGIIEGTPVDESQQMPMTFTGRIQMILDNAPQMAMDLTGNSAGEAMSVNMYLKDGWMYTKADDTAVKMNIADDMDDVLGSYEDLMNVSGDQIASMLPFIDSITTTTSGQNTVYTLTLNRSFAEMLNGMMGLVSESMQMSSLGLDMDMKFDLDQCQYTYTVGPDQQLKSMTAAMKMGLTYSIDADAQNKLTISADMDMSMDMTINAYGSAVAITFPDLSGYQEISE